MCNIAKCAAEIRTEAFETEAKEWWLQDQTATFNDQETLIGQSKTPK